MFTGLAACARGAGRAVLDLLLPPHCLTCDAQVDTPGRFCAECFGRTAFVTEPCCRCCGVPFAHAGQAVRDALGRDGLCPACVHRAPPWRAARAALRYDAQAKRIILPFKYADRTDLARPLAAMMARAGAILLDRADVLVPVPLHRTRLVTRRYNQAALLARALGRTARRPVLLSALLRRIATRPLGELSAEARARAVDGVFAVRPAAQSRVAGRQVLLVDDVMTSGATCAACAEALLAAGAAAVDVILAARVPDPRLT